MFALWEWTTGLKTLNLWKYPKDYKHSEMTTDEKSEGGTLKDKTILKKETKQKSI